VLSSWAVCLLVHQWYQRALPCRDTARRARPIAVPATAQRVACSGRARHLQWAATRSTGACCLPLETL